MKAPSVKQSVFIAMSVVTFSIVSVIVFIIIPSMRQILALKEQTDKTQQFLETQYVQAKQLRRSIRELDSVEQKTGLFQRAEIHAGQELTIIRELEQLADMHHIDQTLHVALINPKTDNDNPTAKKYGNQPYYTFSFLNHGTFADHLLYLRAMESLPYYFLTSSLTWEKRQQTDDFFRPVTVRFDADVLITTAL